MSQLALFASFEYLCYGSKVIRNIFTLTVRGSTLDKRICLQPTTKIYPRTLKSTEPINLNFQPLEVVSCYRDPQPQVTKN